MILDAVWLSHCLSQKEESSKLDNSVSVKKEEKHAEVVSVFSPLLESVG